MSLRFFIDVLCSFVRKLMDDGELLSFDAALGRSRIEVPAGSKAAVGFAVVMAGYVGLAYTIHYLHLAPETLLIVHYTHRRPSSAAAYYPPLPSAAQLLHLVLSRHRRRRAVLTLLLTATHHLSTQVLPSLLLAAPLLSGIHACRTRVLLVRDPRLPSLRSLLPHPSYLLPAALDGIAHRLPAMLPSLLDAQPAAVRDVVGLAAAGGLRVGLAWPLRAAWVGVEAARGPKEGPALLPMEQEEELGWGELLRRCYRGALLLRLVGLRAVAAMAMVVVEVAVVALVGACLDGRS